MASDLTIDPRVREIFLRALREYIDRRRAEQHPRQLLNEELPIRSGKERRPCESVAHRRIHHNRV